MGAEEFQCLYKGETVSEAFENAVNDAYYWHGHSGYTGTICEKPGYIVLDLGKNLTIEEAEEIANELNNSYMHLSPRLVELVGDKDKASNFAIFANSKWDEAVAMKLDSDFWFFCGMASS